MSSRAERHRWGKFYWGDYLADPKLKLCSLAAQGLWMRMLCIAAEANPVGYVMVEGNALGAEEIASECGKPFDTVESALAELTKWGVFSRDRKGRIYSRRMIKDAKRAKTARENGKSGGNPSLGKDSEKRASDNPQVKAGHNTHKPEARSQISEVVLFPESPEKAETQLRRDAAAKRGSRIRTDWRPTGDGMVYAVTEGFDPPAIERMIENFRDYWIAQAGQKATKLDWSATWRTWVRNQRDRQPQQRAVRKQVDWC